MKTGERTPATDDVIGEARRRRAFEAALPLWPEEIDASDREPLPGDGLYVSELSEAWNAAEQQAGALNGGKTNNAEEVKTLLWLMFVCLHEQARHQDRLHPRKLDFEVVDEIYRNGHPARDRFK